MKSEMVILLLLGCISCGVNACTHGDIRIAGVSSDTILAGRVDLCYKSGSESEWRVICQQSWDRKDAMVVCREFGFPAEGAQFCISSCLGRNNTLKGINNFGCSGSETRIVDCQQPLPSLLTGRCVQTIGVICSSTRFDVFDLNSLLPTTSAAEPETTTIVSPTSSVAATTVLYHNCTTQNTDMQNQQDTDASPGSSSKVDSSTIEAILGGVVVVQLIILVSMAIGWVWSCLKNKKIRYITQPNIAYTTPPSSSSFPLNSVGYSSKGPGNMPRNNTSKTCPEKVHVPKSDQGIYEVPVEGNYEVLKESSDAEEDVYHELENTREGKRSELAGEVLSQTKGEDISNAPSVYSTLQHN